MPAGTGKFLSEVDGGTKLTEAIDRTDTGGQRAPGVRSRPLSRIHVALWYANAAITLQYKKEHVDGQYQSGSTDLATESDWEDFKCWLAKCHTRLHYKTNGLLGKSRMTEFGGTKTLVPPWRSAGQGHMKGDAAKHLDLV